jgi:dedicator of cytokinesis protein 3
LSPLENALNEVETKTKELTTLHAKYNALAKTTQQVSTNALAMALNSAVDAPLNTGIASYRQLFFNPEYLDQHPERAELVDQLRAAIEEQVHVIDNCLRLHGLLCSPEFIPFHETLMKFFRKNFRDEIRKLVVDDGTDSLMSPNGPQRFPDGPYTPSTPYDTYPGSVSLSRSFSTSSSQRNNTYVIPPLQLGKNTLTPPPGSPAGAAHNILGSGSSQQLPPTKQTPLQRHLAHLTKHGINAVSSSPGQMPADDGSSPTESPHNSFVNVGNGSSNGIQGTLIGGAHSTTQVSSGATSTAGSYMGSIGSFGSLRGRFSRFGSLNFGRRNGNPS